MTIPELFATLKPIGIEIALRDDGTPVIVAGHDPEAVTDAVMKSLKHYRERIIEYLKAKRDTSRRQHDHEAEVDSMHSDAGDRDSD